MQSTMSPLLDKNLASAPSPIFSSMIATELPTGPAAAFHPPPRNDSLKPAQHQQTNSLTSSDAFMASLFVASKSKSLPQSPTYASENPKSSPLQQNRLRRKQFTGAADNSDGGRFQLPPLPFEQGHTENKHSALPAERYDNIKERTGGMSKGKKWLRGLFGK